MSKNTDLGNLVNGLFVSSTRNVGIGTTTPSQLLEVNNGTASIIKNTSGTRALTLESYAADWNYLVSAGSNLGINVGGANALVINVNSAERMRINSDGTMMLGGTSSSGTAGTGSGRGNLILGGSTSNKITFNNNSTTINGFVYSDSSEFNLTGSGYMVFNTGGSERMRITSAGNVGIGTNSPTTYSLAGRHLELNDAGGGFAFIHNNTTTVKSFFASNESGLLSALFTFSNHPLTFGTNNTERMRITSAGNVGIGTTSPALSTGTGLVVSNTTYLQLRLQSTTQSAGLEWVASSGYRYEVQSSNGGEWFIYNRTTESYSLMIKPNGNILLGTTTDNGERLYVSGSIRATGSITANSDARLKKNIERIENALEKVGQISGYTYNTIYDEDRHAGLIAQEVELVLPEIVNSGTDTYKGIEYGNISALLVEAIKELSAEVQLLKNK